MALAVRALPAAAAAMADKLTGLAEARIRLQEHKPQYDGRLLHIRQRMM